jgi:hypothetical protein
MKNCAICITNIFKEIYYMKQIIKNLLLAASLLFSSTIFATPQCSAEAVIQAKKLLSFHSDGDERAEILADEKVKQLPYIRNPANKKQKFQVLELNGYIYKGEYRMRFIYYPLGSTCVLMGQEILEVAKL